MYQNELRLSIVDLLFLFFFGENMEAKNHVFKTQIGKIISYKILKLVSMIYLVVCRVLTPLISDLAN